MLENSTRKMSKMEMDGVMVMALVVEVGY